MTKRHFCLGGGTSRTSGSDGKNALGPFLIWMLRKCFFLTHQRETDNRVQANSWKTIPPYGKLKPFFTCLEELNNPSARLQPALSERQRFICEGTGWDETHSSI
uniref:Uncharacterized protein n=1 Tax=Sphaerodactylus townsendi TaxID=933632 RepID=A0ACB8FL75_9SAUR